MRVFFDSLEILILCTFYRRKLSPEALRESVIFAKRITGPEAVKLNIIDRIASDKDLISECKKLGLKALGNNNIQRTDLQYMKEDMIPRRITSKM